MDTLVLNGQSGYSKGAIREDSKVGYTFALVLSQPLTRLTEVRQYGGKLKFENISAFYGIIQGPISSIGHRPGGETFASCNLTKGNADGDCF